MMRAGAVIALLLLACPAAAQPFQCAVTRVSDGDSLLCADGTRVRLYGLDAPERGQPGGTQAWIVLRALAQGRTLDCERIATDRYGRTVATCSHPLAPGDIGARLVRNGHAHAYVAYGGERYLGLQEMAKTDRVGVWATSQEPEVPWLWRARKR